MGSTVEGKGRAVFGGKSDKIFRRISTLNGKLLPFFRIVEVNVGSEKLYQLICESHHLTMHFFVM